MRIKQFTVGELYTNCYILISEKNRAAVIDPGGNGKELLDWLQREGIKVRYILLTHGHYDHIKDAPFLRDKTGGEVCIHPLDGDMLSDRVKSLGVFLGGATQKYISPGRLLREGDTLELDELTISVLETPGHTPGSLSFLCGDLLFSGDTLFCRGRGRTDFPGGDEGELFRSIDRLFSLEGDYRLLSGHGEESTLRAEEAGGVF